MNRIPSSNKLQYCVTERYPNKCIGIMPHRDKEMKEKPICGLSLGCKRIFRLQNREQQTDISLGNGSLYIIKGETNNYRSHSVVCEESKDDNSELCISLTFRYYLNNYILGKL